MKRLFAASVALVLTAGSAFTADFPRTAVPVDQAPVADPAGWTGFYFGLGMGGRWLDANWRATAAFDPNGDPIPFDNDPNAPFSSNGFRASAYAGYNRQIGQMFVVGLEADVGWADNKAVLTSRIPGIGFPGNGSFSQVNGRYDASVRARAGVLVIDPSILVYATGGVAFQRVRTAATCPGDFDVCNPNTGTRSLSNNKTLLGWTLGGGIEGFIVRNWLGRLEYRYAEFEKFSFTAFPSTPDSFGANADLKTSTQMLTAGIAYKAP